FSRCLDSAPPHVVGFVNQVLLDLITEPRQFSSELLDPMADVARASAFDGLVHGLWVECHAHLLAPGPTYHRLNVNVPWRVPAITDIVNRLSHSFGTKDTEVRLSVCIPKCQLSGGLRE